MGGLLDRGIPAVREDDVAAVAVPDVAVGVERMPVGGSLDRGARDELVLGQARLKKLHKGHGLPHARAWVRLRRPLQAVDVENVPYQWDWRSHINASRTG